MSNIPLFFHSGPLITYEGIYRHVLNIKYVYELLKNMSMDNTIAKLFLVIVEVT